MPDRQSTTGFSNPKITSSPNALQLELVRLLTLTPGLTAREIERGLRSKGLGTTRYDVNSRLYSDRDLFLSDGAVPPRWDVMPGLALSLFPDVVLRQELVRALTLQPGASARELVGHLGARGLQVTKTSVNSVLYSGMELFWSNGATLPRWQVMSGLALAPAPQVTA